MKVEVHNLDQSSPIKMDNVRNTYQKGDLYCVMLDDLTVYKFPIRHIFRIKEG